MVLKVDEEEFKGLVRELARSEFLAKHDARKEQLAVTSIVLGHIRRGWRKYEVEAEVPYCRENYGDGRGVLLVHVTEDGLDLGYYCIVSLIDLVSLIDPYIDVAVISRDGETTTSPGRLYRLYELLHKQLGTGTRPLLDLAMKAEKEGDKDVADILRKLYAVLEASKDKIREIEQADYSGAEAEAKAELEKEAERKVEEAVKLLWKAKELARKGDTESLLELLETVVYEVPWYAITITLDDIIYYLRTEGGNVIEDILSTAIEGLLSDYPPYISMYVNALREIDIYDTLIKVAKHFGLEVREEE